MTDKLMATLGTLALLGLGEWFSIASMGSQHQTGDWLIATLVGGPAAALLLTMLIAVPGALIAALRWHR